MLSYQEPKLESYPKRNKHFYLSRVAIKNYKSIASADIFLGPLTFFIGPNGSGKTNILDTLRFTADALTGPLDHALQDRGGIGSVRRKSTGHPTHFGVRLEFTLSNGRNGFFAYRIGAKKGGGFEVQTEKCRIYSSEALGRDDFYSLDRGHVSSSLSNAPSNSGDRFYLVNVSGFPEFREVFDRLSQFRFYNLNPTIIRDLQRPSATHILTRDGSNITTVLTYLKQHNPQAIEHIEEYLEKIVPGVTGVEVANLSSMQTLEFKQGVSGSKHPWKFHANNMSDGTLRAFGILVALFQQNDDTDAEIPLIALEEPEVAIHPAAMQIILESIIEGSRIRQIIVTSHSADLLDNKILSTEEIRSVISYKGSTAVAKINPAARMVLRDNLYSVGELLRLNQLEPDETELAKQSEQIDLFAHE